MAVQIYDSGKNLFGSNPQRFSVTNGGSDVVLIYIRNDDAGFYYQNVSLVPDLAGKDSESWSLKLIPGSRQPTEVDWSLVQSGASASFSDIGTTAAADTTTYFPCWIRVSVPEQIPVQIFESMKLTLKANARAVGT